MTSTERSLATLLAKREDFVSFLERRVGDRALAEDLLHDAFVKSRAALEALREEESAVAWFYRVLRNAVIDHHRRTGRARTGLARFAEELSPELPAAPVKAAVCECVMRLAAELPAAQEEILRKVEVDDMSVKDYAASSGISAGTAGVRVFRAREALRQAVLATCGSCAREGCGQCTCSEPR